MDSLPIRYVYNLSDGTQEIFDLHLDPVRFTLLKRPAGSLPEWTLRSFHQCPACPFPDHDPPYCSVAANLVDLVGRFNHLTSYDEVVVKVITHKRTVSTKTSAQQGISSLMGLLIAISECPHTDFFKPMARFHQPFASEEETIWRAISTYLLTQYFLTRQGGVFDSDLKGLIQIYDNIKKVNLSLAKRLRAVCEADSTVNAVIVLDVFAKSMPPAIEKSLTKLRPVFEPILRHYEKFPAI
jgi:hypothetical protein